eukprot:3362649-Pleurochrysis_carterae.AAC.2
MRRQASRVRGAAACLMCVAFAAAPCVCVPVRSAYACARRVCVAVPSALPAVTTQRASVREGACACALASAHTAVCLARPAACDSTFDSANERRVLVIEADVCAYLRGGTFSYARRSSPMVLLLPHLWHATVDSRVPDARGGAESIALAFDLHKTLCGAQARVSAGFRVTLRQGSAGRCLAATELQRWSV